LPREVIARALDRDPGRLDFYALENNLTVWFDVWAKESDQQPNGHASAVAYRLGGDEILWLGSVVFASTENEMITSLPVEAREQITELLRDFLPREVL
jgi:hypothetical protein